MLQYSFRVHLQLLRLPDRLHLMLGLVLDMSRDLEMMDGSYKGVSKNSFAGDNLVQLEIVLSISGIIGYLPA